MVAVQSDINGKEHEEGCHERQRTQRPVLVLCGQEIKQGGCQLCYVCHESVSFLAVSVSFKTFEGRLQELRTGCLIVGVGLVQL